MGQLIKTSVNDLYGDGNTGQYLYSNDILDSASDIVKILPSGRGNSMGAAVLICGTGSGRIDMTFDTHEMIDAGTAIWIPWDKGAVTGTQVDTFKIKMTALKAVSISGTITFKLSL